ncbi:MAG: hypothetical protein J6X44_06735 [Thermoguttaceae bacterium]|nr:hypothetical protein [Thermoguttaceae bacterium]
MTAKKKKTASGSGRQQSLFPESREFQDILETADYLQFLEECFKGMQISDFPDFSGGFDGGTVIKYFGRWFVPKKQLDDISDDEKQLDDISGAEKQQKRTSPKTLAELRKEGKKRCREFKLEENREWRYFAEELDALRKRAEEHRDEFVYKEIDGEKWQVLPHGVGGQGLKYKWVLSCGGIQIAIFSNPYTRQNLPLISVTLGYEPLYLYPFGKVMMKVETVLDSLGFTIDRDIVSRVDFNVTLVLPFKVVEETFIENRFVTRGRKFDCKYRGNRLETLTVGGGENRKAEVCIYNKTREAFGATRHGYHLSSKGADLLEIHGPKAGSFYTLGFDREDLQDEKGEPKFGLTRVEFRLFREFLKEHNIESYVDLLDEMPRLIPYLTQSYFRAIKESKDDNSHYYEVENADWWDRVIKAFDEIFVQGRSIETPKERRINKCTFMELKKQADGCYSTAFANVPVKGLLKDKEKEMMTFEEYQACYLRACKLDMKKSYATYVKKRQEFLGTIEPLDMTAVKDNSARKMAARQQREERKKKRAEDEKMMADHGMMRVDPSMRDFTLTSDEVPMPEWVEMPRS